MSVRADLVKWIMLSAAKHFTENVVDLSIHVEGQKRTNTDLSDRAELRVDGPALREVSRGVLKVTAEINMLVSTFINPDDISVEVVNLAKIIEAFTDFNVYKYGKNDTDDSALVGCFRLLPRADLRERLEISKFGVINPDTNLMQSTVEGHYEMLISI